MSALNKNNLFLEADIKDNFSDLTVLSFGGGQDSTTILFKILHDENFRNEYAPHNLLVLFADTGNEHPFTYQYMETVIKPLCEKHEIDFVSITNDMGYHGKTWQSLTHQWQNERCTVGSVAYLKTCSHNLKLQPQYRYVEDYISKKYNGIVNNKRKKGYVQFAKWHGKIRWLIGIARGEERRVFDAQKETNLWKKQSVVVQYPLMDIGFNRQDCQDYIKTLGYEIPMPSNCMFCPYVACNELELLWLHKTYPDRFHEWTEHEANKLDDWKHVEKNLGVSGKLHTKGDRKGEAVTLYDLLALAEEKYPDVTLEYLNEYKWSHGHCVASQY